MTTTGSLFASVLEELRIPYDFVDADEVVLSVLFSHTLPPHYIINNILGVNTEVDTKLCADKAYTYDLLEQVVAMPSTKSYLDPAGRYQEYKKFASQEEIILDIKNNFELPVIVKKKYGLYGFGSV